MKFLITGGAGFIGSYLTTYLYNLGHQIFIIDKLSAQVHGKDYKMSYLYNRVKDKATIFVEDIADSYHLDELIETCDFIIHLAAETGTGQSMYEISDYVKSNSFATALLLEKLVKIKHNIQKVILASSRSVYGEGKYHCKSHGAVFPDTRDISHLNLGDFECKCPHCGDSITLTATSEDSRINPLSIYGITKFNQEQLVETTCKAIGIPYTIFRFQNVYGKGQSLNNPYTGILAIFSKLILEAKEINVFEDGLESRDFIHVNDIVHAIYLDILSKSKNQTYNVGTGHNTNVLEIVNLLEDYFKTEVKYKISGSFRLGDIRHNYADLTNIQNILNFHPQVRLKDGIADLLDWVQISHKIETGKSFEESLEEMARLNLLIKK